MTLLSLTAFAETHGVKKQSAAEWKTKGLLVMVGDMIDQEASDANMQARAKGRFRVKAHGGRRSAGVHGATDRPGMGYVAGVKTPPAAQIAIPQPWEGWHPIGNPNTMGSDLRNAVAEGDDDAIDQALDTIQFSQWEDASTAAGWDRWPSVIAGKLAAELGVGPQAVEAALHRHVRERLAALNWTDDDLADKRLSPR